MAPLTDRSKGELAGIVTLAMQDDGDPGELLDVVAEAIAQEAGDGVDGLLALADFLARPDKLAAPQGLPRLAGLLKDGHGERVAGEARQRFRPRTPREALLAILTETRKAVQEPFEFTTLVDSLASAGLESTDPATFEWTDQLAERLARAIVVLEVVDKEGFADNPDLEGQVQEALVLPPDIEAAVDIRRRPPGDQDQHVPPPR